jgi:hypothetical protein
VGLPFFVICSTLKVAVVFCPIESGYNPHLSAETRADHFHSTEKVPGMFATVVVVLPSELTGGDIHVSQNGDTGVHDTSENSAFETEFLAWYTDVTHEVREITSGYRLALSYHLINTSPDISPHTCRATIPARSISVKSSPGGRTTNTPP